MQPGESHRSRVATLARLRRARRRVSRQVGHRASVFAGNAVFRVIARAGFVVTGIVHVLIGWTAVRMGLGAHGDDVADQQGAIRIIEAVPGGIVVLVLGGGACVALATWFLFEGLGGALDLERPRERAIFVAQHVGKGVAYALVAGSVAGVLTDTAATTEEVVARTSSTLLATVVGSILMLLVAVALIGTGVAFVVIGARRSFVRDLDLTRAWRRPIVGVMVVGYVARGIAFVLMGGTFIAAVVTQDPAEAAGMSGALSSLLELPFGNIALVIVGVGLIVGGLAVALRARVQRM